MLVFIKRYWFILLYLGLYFIAINAVVLNRFWQFEALYFDHGIFDSSLWQVAHLHIPIIDHNEAGFISQLTDHFSPTMYLLVPIYWLWTTYEPLLVIGNLFVVASAFVVLLIAKGRITNSLFVFAIIIAYTLYIGLQNTIIANFHTELIALLTIGITLLAIEKKKWVWYWVFLVLTLGTKENFASIGLGIGIYVFFLNHRVGAVTIILSVIYYFLITKVAIPNYAYGQIAFGNFFLPTVKTETMLVSFATFGFLPLGAITFPPSIFQDFFGRFVINAGSERWDLGMHYNATLGILLSYGTILVASKLNKKLVLIFTLIIISTTVYFHRFKYHGPLGLAYNPVFYQHTGEMFFTKDFLSHVPKNKTVMTLNNLATYLTHTNSVMLLRGDYRKYKPDIIVLDLRPGQNPVNFWPGRYNDALALEHVIRADSEYKIIYTSGDQVIYSR
jgi:uncharacterized membrane protein